MYKDIVKMMIYLVLSVKEKEEQNTKKCLEELEKWYYIMKNNGIKDLRNLVKIMPEIHPVNILFGEISKNDKDAIMENFEIAKMAFEKAEYKDFSEFEEDKEVEELAEEIASNIENM